MTDLNPASDGAPKLRKDPMSPASPTSDLVADIGAHIPQAHTPPAQAAAAPERKSFAGQNGDSDPQPGVEGEAQGAAAATPAQLASDADALLRASLETIRSKAEDLRRQTTDWAGLRSDQARELIDERPLTVVASAFGVGLIAGMLFRR